METIRASSLPRVAACAASLTPPAVLIEPPSPEADLGSAVHQVLAAWIAGGWMPETCELAARQWRADVKEVEMLAGIGWRLWCDKLAPWFPPPHTREGKLTLAADGFTLTGHPDLLSVPGDGTLRVLDWKTGRLDADHTDQLRGYALLALAAHPECDRAYAAVVWLREQEIDPHWYTREELEDWWAGLVHHLRTRREVYSPSRDPAGYCTYCPRRFECAARNQQLDHARELLLLTDAVGRLTDVQIGDLHSAVLAYERQIEAVRALVRTEVAIRGGRVDIGDGRELALTETQKRAYAAKIALPLLIDRLGMDAVAGAVTIGVGAIDDAVAETAPRGAKGATIKQFGALMEAEGALYHKQEQRLVCRRKIEAIEEKS